MCSPKMPDPPNPYETGAAQTQTNVQTAIANNRMGMVDQVTPYGSLTYETIYDQPQGQPMTGQPQGQPQQQWDYRYNPDTQQRERVRVNVAPQGAQSGQSGSLTGGFGLGDVPRYRATTTLSPGQQRILDASTGAKGELAELAQERSAFLKDYLPNASPESIDAKLMELGSQRLDPRFARDEEALRNRLAQQGLTQGSAAWDTEMERFGQNKNDAYNQLTLQGRGQALAEINNPINQIAALLGLGQVQNPQVQMQQPQGMPTVNQAGLIQQDYQNRANQAASQPSLLGGLFGLANTAINPTSMVGRMFPGAA